MAFSLLGAPILLQELYKLVSGQIDDDHLMLIQESEESPHGDADDTSAKHK
jgi:hypothetical protein